MEKTTDLRGTNPSADQVTLGELYEQFKRPLHSYSYRLLGNQEDADDVTQEVFVRVCTSWNDLDERAHLSPWLYRIATNLCLDVLRRKKRLSWRSLVQQHSDDPPEAVVNEDSSSFLADNGGIPEIAERELIRMTLSSMPEEYAVALMLSAAQGVSYQEVASIVGISPMAAATRISRAKTMFAEQYQRLSKDDVDKDEKKSQK